MKGGGLLQGLDLGLLRTIKFDSPPNPAAYEGWLSPWADDILLMWLSGISPETIARAVEPLADAYYRAKGHKSAYVKPAEIRVAIWRIYNPAPRIRMRDAKYRGWLFPVLGNILQMHDAGFSIPLIIDWIHEYQLWSPRRLDPYYCNNLKTQQIRYVLMREGRIQPRPPIVVEVEDWTEYGLVEDTLSDVEIYEDTLDCVYAAWAADREAAWRNRSRPIDMGGPRGVWIERSEWDLL